MRLPRMTTRRWMVAVAFAAVGLAAGVVYRQHLYYLERAEYHEQRAREGVFRADMVWESAVAELGLDLDSLEWIAFEIEVEDLDRDIGLMEKYRRAARYPWLPVEPDPPEPWP